MQRELNLEGKIFLDLMKASLASGTDPRGAVEECSSYSALTDIVDYIVNTYAETKEDTNINRDISN